MLSILYHRWPPVVLVGLLFTFAGLGGMIGPWLVGIASDLSGELTFGFGLNLVFGLLTAACAVVLLQLRHKAANPAQI